jgi:hypothetical protein
MEKYYKDIQKQNVTSFKSDFLIQVINENINCDKLLNNSVVLKYPLFLTIVLNGPTCNKEFFNNFFMNEVTSYIKEQSSFKYIFYQV